MMRRVTYLFESPVELFQFFLRQLGEAAKRLQILIGSLGAFRRELAAIPFLTLFPPQTNNRYNHNDKIVYINAYKN